MERFSKSQRRVRYAKQQRHLRTATGANGNAMLTMRELYHGLRFLRHVHMILDHKHTGGDERAYLNAAFQTYLNKLRR